MVNEEIRELLALRRWNTTKLAAEIGTRENTISTWLSGRRNPRDVYVKQIRQLLAESRSEAAAVKAG